MVATAILPLLLTGLTGLVLARTLLRDESVWRGIERVTFVVLIPALIVSTLAEADLSSLPTLAIAVAFIGALTVVVALLVTLYAMQRKRWHWGAPAWSSVFQSATRWNASVAIAIVAGSLADEAIALVAVTMVLMMPIVNVLNVVVLVRVLAGAEASIADTLVRIASNPIIVGCAIGLGLAVADVTLPVAVSETLATLGAASIPLVMLAIGAALDLPSVVRPDRDVLIACGARLVLFPALVLVAVRALGLDEPLVAAAIVCAAVPTAANGYVLARELGGDAPLYARIATVQVMLSLFTLPAWLAIAL